MSTKPILDFSSLVAQKARDFASRSWVMTAIDKWLGDPQGSQVFLLTGEPGSGKTAVAARLAAMSAGQAPAEGYRHLGPGSFSSFHFCQFHYMASIEPQVFLESLSEQLAGQAEGE